MFLATRRPRKPVIKPEHKVLLHGRVTSSIAHAAFESFLDCDFDYRMR